MFIAEMSASLRTLSNTSVNDLPLQFTLTKDNEYIHFYHADDVRLAEDIRITGIDLRVSKERDGMAPLLNFPRQVSASHSMPLKALSGAGVNGLSRGRSGNEVTSYTAPEDMNGQKASFSFSVNKPDCLDSVVISAGSD